MEPQNTIAPVAKAYIAAKAVQADLAKQTKAANKRLEKATEMLLEEFEETGMERVSVDGKTLTPSTSLHANISVANQPAMIELCKGLGIEETVTTKCETPRIKGKIKEWMSSPKLEDCDPPQAVADLIKASNEELLLVQDWLSDGGKPRNAPISIQALADDSDEVSVWLDDSMKGVPKKVRELVSIYFEPKILMCASSR